MRTTLLAIPLAVMLLLVAAPRPADAFMHHGSHQTAFGAHRFRNVSPFIFTDRGFFFIFNGRTFFSKFPPGFNRVGTPFASSFGSFGSPFTASPVPFGTNSGFVGGFGGFGDSMLVALPPTAATLSTLRERGFSVEKTQGVTVIRGPGSHHAH